MPCKRMARPTRIVSMNDIGLEKMIIAPCLMTFYLRKIWKAFSAQTAVGPNGCRAQFLS
jgi:hypothetical protein